MCTLHEAHHLHYRHDNPHQMKRPWASTRAMTPMQTSTNEGSTWPYPSRGPRPQRHAWCACPDAACWCAPGATDSRPAPPVSQSVSNESVNSESEETDSTPAPPISRSEHTESDATNSRPAFSVNQEQRVVSSARSADIGRQ